MTVRTLTLRRAIVLAVMLGLLLPAILIGCYSWLERYDEDIHKGTFELLQQNVDILSSGMQEPLWNVNQESANALIEAMMRHEDIVRIEVRDNSLGIFVAGSQPKRRFGHTSSIKKNVVYRGNTIGSIEIEIGSSRLRKIVIGNLLDYMIALAAQAVLAVMLILVILEKRLVRPLTTLGKGAELLAAGQLDMPFTWRRLDEIGRLSQRLEITRISLRRLFDELGEKNQELEHDIDKRKRIEQELREREARLRTMVDQSPIAIIEWDLACHVIEWNPAAERIFGYSREQAIGQHARFIAPDCASGTVDDLFKITTNKSRDESSSVNENLNAGGQMIVCHWNNTSIEDEQGRTSRLLSMVEDITERRQAEEARRLSEAKFSGAFQCNPDSVAITRLNDGIFLDVNQTFESITGHARDELIGKNAIELDLWANPEQRAMLIRDLNQYKIVRDFSWRMRNKSGKIRDCLINSTLFNVGQEPHMLAVIRDITDQRLLEQQKTEADRALLRLAQGTQGMAGESFFELLVTDLACALGTEIAFISVRSTEAPDQLRTVAIFENGQLIDNLDYPINGSISSAILAGDLRVFSAGIQQQFPDDASLRERSLESYAGAPLRDAAGDTIGVLAVLDRRPLNNPGLVQSLLQVFSERASSELERKRADQALRNSAERFSSIFHSSPVAMSVVCMSDDYRIRDVNSAFERLFKLDLKSTLGKNTLELSLYRDPALRASVINTVEKDGRHSHYEAWMNRADGSQVFVQISENMFILAGEKFVTTAFEDITDKFNTEIKIRDLNINLEQRVIERTNELQKANGELASTLETLNRAQEELVRSEKLAALGSLVAGVAHELNTPIGNSVMVASTLVDQTKIFVQSYAGGLKRSELESFIRDASKAGQILVRNLQRAADMVTSFKQVAVDQTSSQRRPFSLSEVISEIMLTLSPSIKKTNFKVEHTVPHGISMDSYPGPLGQVITNLVNNALIHGFDQRESGMVLIEASQLYGGWIELTVRDDGLGITPENLNRIYDPFFTTKLGAGGSGLGLNITHNIVTGILGGRINVVSEVGNGTTFTMTIPMQAPQKHREEKSKNKIKTNSTHES